MKPQRKAPKLPKWFKVAAISFGLLYLLGFVIMVIITAKVDQSPEVLEKREERRIEKANERKEAYETNREYMDWFKEHDAEVRQRLEAYDYAVEQGDLALIREKLNDFWLIPAIKERPLKGGYDPEHWEYTQAVTLLRESTKEILGSTMQKEMIKEAKEKEEKVRNDLELHEQHLDEAREEIYEDD